MSAAPLSYAHLGEPLGAYRVVLPWLAYCLHLGGFGVLVLPIAANVVNFAILFRVLSARMNKSAGLLCTASIALTQVGQVGNTWLGWPDPICFLLLTLTMVVRKRWWLIPLITAGVLTDERFLVGLAGTLLWRAFAGPESGLSFKAAARSLVTPVSVGIVCSIIVRYLLRAGYIGPAIPMTVYNNAAFPSWFYKKWWYRPLAMFFAFRWLWLVPCTTLLMGVELRRRLVVPAVALAISCFLLTIPGDMTRSLAVMFPLILLFCIALNDDRPWVASKVIAASFILNIVTPMLNIFLLNIWPSYPLPAVIWRMVHGNAGGFHWRF